MARYYKPLLSLSDFGKTGMSPEEIFSGEQEEGFRRPAGFVPVDEIADDRLDPEKILLLKEEESAMESGDGEIVIAPPTKPSSNGGKRILIRR